MYTLSPTVALEIKRLSKSKSKPTKILPSLSTPVKSFLSSPQSHHLCETSRSKIIFKTNSTIQLTTLNLVEEQEQIQLPETNVDLSETTAQNEFKGYEHVPLNSLLTELSDFVGPQCCWYFTMMRYIQILLAIISVPTIIHKICNVIQLRRNNISGDIWFWVSITSLNVTYRFLWLTILIGLYLGTLIMAKLFIQKVKREKKIFVPAPFQPEVNPSDILTNLTQNKQENKSNQLHEEKERKIDILSLAIPTKKKKSKVTIDSTSIDKIKVHQQNIELAIESPWIYLFKTHGRLWGRRLLNFLFFILLLFIQLTINFELYSLNEKITSTFVAILLAIAGSSLSMIWVFTSKFTTAMEQENIQNIGKYMSSLALKSLSFRLPSCMMLFSISQIEQFQTLATHEDFIQNLKVCPYSLQAQQYAVNIASSVLSAVFGNLFVIMIQRKIGEIQSLRQSHIINSFSLMPNFELTEALADNMMLLFVILTGSPVFTLMPIMGLIAFLIKSKIDLYIWLRLAKQTKPSNNSFKTLYLRTIILSVIYASVVNYPYGPLYVFSTWKIQTNDECFAL